MVIFIISAEETIRIANPRSGNVLETGWAMQSFITSQSVALYRRP